MASYQAGASNSAESLRPYVESINLYIEYIKDSLNRRIVQWVEDLWHDSKARVPADLQGDYADLVFFQEQLLKTPDWDEEKIAKVMEELFGAEHLQISKERIKKAVETTIAANTALLAAARRRVNELTIQAPSASYFVHQVLVNVAEELYESPQIVKEKMRAQMNSIVDKQIERTIRSLTPYADILDDTVKQVEAATSSDQMAPAAQPVPDQSAPDSSEPVQPPVDQPQSDQAQPQPPVPAAGPVNEAGGDGPPSDSDDDNSASDSGTDTELPPVSVSNARATPSANNSSRSRPRYAREAY